VVAPEGIRLAKRLDNGHGDGPADVLGERELAGLRLWARAPDRLKRGWPRSVSVGLSASMPWFANPPKAPAQARVGNQSALHLGPPHPRAHAGRGSWQPWPFPTRQSLPAQGLLVRHLRRPRPRRGAPAPASPGRFATAPPPRGRGLPQRSLPGSSLPGRLGCGSERNDLVNNLKSIGHKLG
jgi:hypothetical protein